MAEDWNTMSVDEKLEHLMEGSVDDHRRLGYLEGKDVENSAATIEATIDILSIMADGKDPLKHFSDDLSLYSIDLIKKVVAVKENFDKEMRELKRHL